MVNIEKKSSWISSIEWVENSNINSEWLGDGSTSEKILTIIEKYFQSTFED